MKPYAPIAAFLGYALLGCATPEHEGVHYSVDQDAIAQPLTMIAGDAARGREVVIGREGNCLLCHAVPESGERFMGNVAPPLSGVGTRLSSAQLRLRVVDPTRLKPDVAMPAYYRTQNLDIVAEQFRGKPLLTAQQIEDVVAYLSTLR
jgi:L-cysteine S-thiosulfotransferase